MSDLLGSSKKPANDKKMKAEIRGASALAAARGRTGTLGALGLSSSKGSAFNMSVAERIRHPELAAGLQGGTSLARVKRHVGRDEAEALKRIREELENEEVSEAAKHEAIARLALAKPLPDTILRPKPKRTRDDEEEVAS